MVVKRLSIKLLGIFCYKIPVILCCMGKSDKGTCKLVLKHGSICLFSADTGPSCASYILQFVHTESKTSDSP